MIADMFMTIWLRGAKHALFKFETPRSLGIIGRRGVSTNFHRTSPTSRPLPLTRVTFHTQTGGSASPTR